VFARDRRRQPNRPLHARLAIGGGDRDVAAKADDEVELQFLGQHPIELVVAEAAIGPRNRSPRRTFWGERVVCSFSHARAG
jgi:hypothetical protein